MILVTGGTGYLGSRLVERLKKDDDVLVLSRKNKPGFIRGDVSDYHTVEKAIKDVDIVFHLSVFSDQLAPYEKHHKTTVIGAENVLRAAEKHGIKVVYMSSNAIKNKNKTNYAIAKAHAEEIARNFGKRNTVPIIRTSLIYDKALINGLRRISYLPFPYKRQKMHLAYRESVVDALIGAMKYGKSEVYEVADREPVLLTDLFKEIARPRPMLWVPPQTVWLLAGLSYPIEATAKALGVRPPTSSRYILSLFEERVMNIEKAIKVLKYTPVDTLETIRKIKSGDTEI